MHTRRLEGVYPIVATPFRADGACDVDDLRRVVDFIIASGADGLVFPGVASEFDTLTKEERFDLFATVAAAAALRAPVVVGASAADARSAAAFAEQGRECGASAVMAMAPPTMRGNRDAQCEYFRAIAEAGLPIILQNAPAPIGCGLAPDETLEVVKSVRGIRYVKEETLPSGQRISKLLAPKAAEIDGVFGGAGGRYITDELVRGACGTMPACELSDLHVMQFKAHRAGDAHEVRRLFNRMLPLLNFQAVFRMAMTKEVLRRRGIIDATHVRAAGPTLDDGDMRELDRLLADVADLLPVQSSRSTQ
jgi:4-hydroxy-tetrahydrodipicolinate synthase